MRRDLCPLFYGRWKIMSSAKNLARKRRGRQTKIDTATNTEKMNETKQDKNLKTKMANFRKGLISYQELPDYMKDNEYILGYYRAGWSLKEALLSIFQWHNETLNVWTHLIGFFLFLGLTLVHLNQVPNVADLLNSFTRSFSMAIVANASNDRRNFFQETSSFMKPLESSSEMPSSMTTSATRWPFFVFLGGSMFCLLSSSICHLMCCHSRRLNLFLLRVDYSGIAIMIVASFFPPMYYIFQCAPHWQILYLAGITTMGVLAVITLLSPVHSTSAFRTFRALLFCSMAFSGIVPAVHAVIINWAEPRRNITLAYELAMALFYVIGAMFYVSRIPEKWKPGFFDLAGHSHQIFHVLVIFGALAHYCAALIFMEYRDRVGCD